jgi:hypothetical protein
MPGMTSPTGPAATALAAAFKAALLSQGTVVFFVFVLLAIAWVTCRELMLAKARPYLTARLAARNAASTPEPAGRRVLRIGFGLLWILDGLLQAQPTMPGGLPSHVLASAVTGSPGWVVRMVGWAARGWSAHPVEAAAGAVWIQLGLGVWLLSAASPRWSRLAGLVASGWGLVVWVFGEAFGSMLAPGQSWLMGAPGAALFYCAAGLLVALPVASWQDGRLGRRVLQASGALMLMFAVLESWPGRGFWQGSQHGKLGSLAAGIGTMSTLRQPAVLHTLISGASVFVAGHGVAVNLAIVVVLAGTGGCLLTGRAALARPAALMAIVFCLADWVLVQDLGFLGGIGTDPNSMVPQAILLTAGLLAMAAAHQSASMAQVAPTPLVLTPLVLTPPVLTPPVLAPPVLAPPVLPPPVLTQPVSTPTSARPRQLAGGAVRSLGVTFGTASTSSVLTLWAAAMLVLGALPMAVEFARLS